MKTLVLLFLLASPVWADTSTFTVFQSTFFSHVHQWQDAGLIKNSEDNRFAPRHLHLFRCSCGGRKVEK